MLRLALRTFFTTWVLLDAEVLEPVRTPLFAKLDELALTSKAAEHVAVGADCRVCTGFWVSLVLARRRGDIAAANAIHLLLVMGHAWSEWSIEALQQQTRQTRKPA